jgi:putative transposase
MEYRKGSHTVYNIQYHFVWVTKYRYHVLEGEVKLRVREIIRQICQQHDLLIEQGHISKDHVHILVSAPTHLSASQIMQKIKGRSSRVLQQEFPHLKKRYWGQHIWARGYFCTTVGQVTDQMIRDYIEGHVGKSPDDSFTVDED